eukprot:1408725-Prymnesium_polylepis.1
MTAPGADSTWLTAPAVTCQPTARQHLAESMLSRLQHLTDRIWYTCCSPAAIGSTAVPHACLRDNRIDDDAKAELVRACKRDGGPDVQLKL